MSLHFLPNGDQQAKLPSANLPGGVLRYSICEPFLSLLDGQLLGRGNCVFRRLLSLANVGRHSSGQKFLEVIMSPTSL